MKPGCKFAHKHIKGGIIKALFRLYVWLLRSFVEYPISSNMFKMITTKRNVNNWGRAAVKYKDVHPASEISTTTKTGRIFFFLQ
jgi:hypothetical protein